MAGWCFAPTQAPAAAAPLAGALPWTQVPAPGAREALRLARLPSAFLVMLADACKQTKKKMFHYLCLTLCDAKGYIKSLTDFGSSRLKSARGGLE